MTSGGEIASVDALRAQQRVDLAARAALGDRQLGHLGGARRVWSASRAPRRSSCRAAGDRCRCADRCARRPASHAARRRSPTEITPSRASRLPTCLELVWAGMVTVTLPWGEPWKGWKSWTRNQITPAPSSSATNDANRPTQECRRRPVVGARGGLTLLPWRSRRDLGCVRRVTRRVPAGAWRSSSAASAGPPRPPWPPRRDTGDPRPRRPDTHARRGHHPDARARGGPRPETRTPRRPRRHTRAARCPHRRPRPS